MTTEEPRQLLARMCADLRLLWTQAGGPTLVNLSTRVGLGKSQVGAILNGRIRRPPDWRVVNDLVTAIAAHARGQGRVGQVSVPMGVEEFWRSRYTLVEHAFEHAPRGSRSSPPPESDATPRPVPVPRELPGDVYAFTGRTAALAELTRLVDVPRSSAVGISVVSGAAGVGKTALTVHWAHQVAHRFPDGQLYVDLRGYHPGEPMAPADALATFLSSLGVKPEDMPADTAGRSARYRTLLAGRRLLVLLDNARSADQVRPLLPGTPSCATLVTSRSDLAGLVARDGARRTDLDVLSLDEAVALLRTLVGARIDADPTAAAVLAERCALLPLAIRVAAELAVARPAAPLGQLVDDLRDQRRSLDLLDSGDDPHTAIRSVLSWSCRHLPRRADHALTLLGLHPGAAFDGYALAALLDAELNVARSMLDELTRAHLVEQRSPDRYGMHDLLRAYTAERAAAELDGAAARAALTRLFDHYLRTAAVAMAAVFPAEHALLPRVPAPVTPHPPVAALEPALAWLDRERPNLVAVAVHAAANGWADHSVHLSGVLFPYLDGHPDAALAVHTSAVRTAPANHAGRPGALGRLGTVELKLGRPANAIDHLRETVAAHRATGNRSGELGAVANLGFVYESLGHYAEALDQYRYAHRLCQEVGDGHREGLLLATLGTLLGRLGRHPEAAEHHREALAVARARGDRRLVGVATTGLGSALAGLGSHREALDVLTDGLAIGREVREVRIEAAARRGLGQAHAGLREYAVAIEHLECALVTIRAIDDRHAEIEILNVLGETLCDGDRPELAVERHRMALDLTREIGYRPEEARALAGLALALHDTGQPAQADRYRREALAISADLGLPTLSLT